MLQKHKKVPLFPSRIAKGQTFCNRTQEKKRIRNNIENIQHTLIISPRRYGKTSLAVQTLHEAKVPYTYIQFFNAFRDEIVLKRFVDGLGAFIKTLMPKTKKAFLKLVELMGYTKATVSYEGIHLELGLQALSKNPIDIIRGYLTDLDLVLKKKNMAVVLFLDEFQDIAESDLSDELQAMIRDFAQMTDHVTFIVSGSHRHMLAKMFDDSNKPFYKFFDRIDLKRIDRAEYISFIQRLAIKKWKKKFSDNVLNHVLDQTECHAYYVNRLCSKLWELDTIASLKDVDKLWKILVEEEFGSLANDLSALTKNQRIILQAMSSYSTVPEPTATAFLQKVRLSPRSVQLAMGVLEKTDHIEKVQDGYRVVDPVAKHVLAY